MNIINETGRYEQKFKQDVKTIKNSKKTQGNRRIKLGTQKSKETTIILIQVQYAELNNL